jgi:phospho-N-acetylmuramoyl-pentapeptide-transferase
MLYRLADILVDFWGPFRLLKSHVLLLAGGTFCAAALTAWLLPKFWCLLPKDRGKAILGKDGMNSEGKPTGAGLIVTLVAFPVMVIFAPLAFWDLMTVVAIYVAMLFGYLDDRAEKPWGELKKGLLDAVVALMIALFIYLGHAEEVVAGKTAMICWVPFFKHLCYIPGYIYIPVAAAILWFTMNATNCSDGVDGLAGSLTIIALIMLAVVLYVIVGYRPVAHYFLLPVYSEAARWAIVSMIVVGAFGGYLWFNAEPSKILMGDAGSRFLGVFIATASLMTGNPFFVFALVPVIIVNGGGGLAKLVLLRTAKYFGRDVSQDAFIRKIRFPLHDHCKKNLGWSNAQVLMRFVLFQLAVMPILIILLIKIR